MALHRSWLVFLLVAVLTLSANSADSGVFVRFKLLEPTNYYVKLGGYIHVEPPYLPAEVWPTGADKDSTKRVPSGAFTDWLDLGKYAAGRLHGRLQRAGGVAEFPNLTADFMTSAESPHAESRDRAGHGADRERGGQAA